MASTRFGHWLEADWRERAKQPAPQHGQWLAGQGFSVPDADRTKDEFTARVHLDRGQLGVLAYASEDNQCAYVTLPWEAWQELVAEVAAQRGRYLATRAEDRT